MLTRNVQLCYIGVITNKKGDKKMFSIKIAADKTPKQGQVMIWKGIKLIVITVKEKMISEVNGIEKYEVRVKKA